MAGLDEFQKQAGLDEFQKQAGRDKLETQARWEVIANSSQKQSKAASPTPNQLWSAIPRVEPETAFGSPVQKLSPEDVNMIRNTATIPYTPYTGQYVAHLNAQQNLGIANIYSNATSSLPHQRATGIASANAMPLTAATIQQYMATIAVSAAPSPASVSSEDPAASALH